MIIGSHVSFEKGEFLGAVEEALGYGANTFMFYTGAPSNSYRKELNLASLSDAKKLMQENNINLENIICHAPYIINLANNDSNKYDFSINFLKKEIKRCEELGVKYIVLHPGSFVHLTKEEGIENIINALNLVISRDDKCMILLETMAGKGSELGRNIEEIKSIIDGVELKDKIGVCVDTCHINDAGYDVSKFDEYLNEFDLKIGIDKIKCLHINDSKNLVGTHKDRHENIGLGTIGFDTLLSVLYNAKLKDVPKILETPYIGNTDDDKKRLYPPYKFEIEMIRKKEFNPNLLEDIRSFYK